MPCKYLCLKGLHIFNSRPIISSPPAPAVVVSFKPLSRLKSSNQCFCYCMHHGTSYLEKHLSERKCIVRLLKKIPDQIASFLLRVYRIIVSHSHIRIFDQSRDICFKENQTWVFSVNSRMFIISVACQVTNLSIFEKIFDHFLNFCACL